MLDYSGWVTSHQYSFRHVLHYHCPGAHYATGTDFDRVYNGIGTHRYLVTKNGRLTGPGGGVIPFPRWKKNHAVGDKTVLANIGAI